MMQIGGSGSTYGSKIGVVTGNTEQAETDDQHAGDGAALEGHVQCCGNAATGSLGSAYIGTHRDVHPDKAGCTGEDRADQEADGGQPAQLRHEADDQKKNHPDDGNGLVLPVEVGRSPLLNCLGNLLHARVAWRQRKNLPAGNPAVQYRDYGAGKRQY